MRCWVGVAPSISMVRRYVFQVDLAAMRSCSRGCVPISVLRLSSACSKEMKEVAILAWRVFGLSLKMTVARVLLPAWSILQAVHGWENSTT